MDDVPEEQIKKKKRLVLLLLLALLGVTAGAAALIEPAPPATIAALAQSPSPPTANTFTATSQVRGDEWLQPTLPGSTEAGRDAAQTADATVGASKNEASSPNSTPTVKRQQKSEIGLTSTEPGPTPSSASVETREVTGEPEVNPVTPITSESGTAVVGALPSTNPDGSDVSTPVVPIEENETVINSGEATLIPTKISRRINESWDVLDGRYISTAEAEDTSLALAATATLTKPATLSETLVIIPPDGLPVTGTLARRGMNWGAVAVVVVLLGAGVGALFYPRPQ